jgi:Cu2+-exporting ATPase
MIEAVAERCYHCGLGVPSGANYSLMIGDQLRPMCCPGCAAVAATIVGSGLGSFYKFRSAPNVLVNQGENSTKNPYLDWDIPEIQNEFITRQDQGQQSIRLFIDNITCAACTWLIEKHLAKLNGVEEINVNGTTLRAEVVWDPQRLNLSEILNAISQIGYTASPINDSSDIPDIKDQSRKLLLRLGVAGLAMMQTGMVSIALYAGSFQGMEQEWQTLLRLVTVLFVTPVVFYSAQPFFSNAWRSLKMLHLVMDVPVALAIALAYIASLYATFQGGGEVYFDSITMFTFFLLLGRFAEQRIRHKNLLLLNRGHLLPPVITQIFPSQLYLSQRAKSARSENNAWDENSARGEKSVWGEKSACGEKTVPIKTLKIGDFIRVNAGQTIPCDGLIVSGDSQVSEALLTGESRPLPKQAGATVYAGTINGANPLEVEVAAIGEGTKLSTILKLAERAAMHKPRWAGLADRMAGWFIGALLIIAAAVAWYWSQQDPDRALWITLSILVVTCPCALSLATPTALSVASGRLRAQGFLINRAHVLEVLPTIGRVIFDKTGTLTEGNLNLLHIALARSQSSISERQILDWAATLEQGSEHPIARALLQADVEKGVGKDIAGQTVARKVEQQQFVTGCGVTGRINDDRFAFGNPQWITAASRVLGDVEIDVSAQEKSTVDADPVDNRGIEVGLARNGELITKLYFGDQLRDSASLAVNHLRDRGLNVSLLSGDPSPAAAEIVRPLALNDCHFSLQPEQKLNRVQQLQQQGQPVLMVGDGINDVPVLQAADVSVAMGQASELSQINADVILLSNDLTVLPDAIAVAAKTRRIIKQNICWAIGYNLIALPLAAMGYVPPWAAAIGMSASSLIVLLNALRISPRESR